MIAAGLRIDSSLGPSSGVRNVRTRVKTPEDTLTDTNHITVLVMERPEVVVFVPTRRHASHPKLGYSSACRAGILSERVERRETVDDDGA